VSIIGELDIYNNKLYVEFHNFDQHLPRQPQPTNNLAIFGPQPIAWEKITNVLYKSLFDNPK
jgi:hypothetical protein